MRSSTRSSRSPSTGSSSCSTREYANVQPHSGATANAAAYHALASAGDTVLGLDLANGGHLTHGMKLNFSGRLYNVVPYKVDDQGYVDMDELAALAREHQPRIILAGWSAYPRQLDFARFREIADDVGASLFVDMAHFAGLVAAGLHPSPLPHAHIVTTTTHKTLGGPRGGAILTNDEEVAKKMRSAVFPGQQGGPLEHVIAAKAVAFKMALEPEFKERQQRTLDGARILADRMLADDARAAGIQVVSGGTDVHLVLVDLRESELDGKQAEDRLDEVGITVNRNAVPNDPRPPMVTSGLRIGTPALATRGFGDDEFREVADVIVEALKPGDVDIESLRKRTGCPGRALPALPGRPAVRRVKLWLRPGLLGLHVFAVAAVGFCVVMGLWQLGVYEGRQESMPRTAHAGRWCRSRTSGGRRAVHGRT